MKYKIVTGYLAPYGKDIPNIVDKVNSNLAAGFVLVGSLIHTGENSFAQAMTYTKKGESK